MQALIQCNTRLNQQSPDMSPYPTYVQGKHHPYDQVFASGTRWRQQLLWRQQQIRMGRKGAVTTESLSRFPGRQKGANFLDGLGGG